MLEIITGRAGSGKTAYVLGQIYKELMARPLGPAIILLLPEHMTYKVERQLAAMMEKQGRGYMRCQIYGFKRFAYHVLQETGGALEQGITDMGRQLLLKSILDKRYSQLKVFGRASRQRGFANVLSSIINELKGYGISPELLQEAGDSIDDSRLANKLSDLAMLYGDYNDAMAGRYNDGKDIMSILAERLPMSKMVAGAEIWLDGFLFFNPLELKVLEGLFTYGANVHVTFNMDDMASPQGQWANQEASGLFNRAYISRNRLLQLAQRLNISVEYRHFAETKRFANPVLKALEAGFDKRRMEPVAGAADISLVEAATCRLEVEAAAADIIRLVKEKGYKWRDIGILIRDEDSYGDILNFVFKDYEIPFFSDKKRQCANHPVAELIRSAIAITEGWSYDDMFCCIKTGFFRLTAQQTDLLENYCLEFNLKGKKVWRRQEPWEYFSRYSIDEENEQADSKQMLRAATADQLRRQVAEPLGRLQDALKAAADTRAMIQAIYQFMTDIEVPKILQEWSDQAEQSGALDVAREHQQVWNDIMEMLDQLVEVSGDTKMSIKELRQLLEEGLSSLEMALVPPGLDYVNIASFDQNALDNIKAVYILGANVGIMPGKSVENTVLSDADRMHINRNNVIELSVSGEEASFNENYLIYKAFTQAREYMWVSYSLSSPAGDAMTGSEIVTKIKSLLPENSIKTIPLDWISKFSEDDQLKMLANKRQTLSSLAIALRELRDAGELSELWQRVYNYLLEDEDVKGMVGLIRRGLFMNPRLDKLPRDIAKELYAARGVLRGSVTKFERYNNCPFQFFAQYGLNLKERKISRFSSPELGTLLHAVLKEYGERLNKEGRRWGDIAPAERDALCHEILHRLAPRLNNGVLYNSKQMEAQLRRLESTAKFALKRLAEFDHVSKFHPQLFERSFGGNHGPEDTLELVYKLHENNRLELVGQIDRIDVNEQGSHFMIMDYKTGYAAINLVDVYYGLKLQLLTYLLVANELMKRGQDTPMMPAGMLYFFLKRPVLTMKNHSHDPEFIRAALDEELKMPGWVLLDKDIAEQIDNTLYTDNKSRFLKISYKKDLSFSLPSLKMLKSQEDFAVLMGYIELILQETGEQIMDGRIDIQPVRKDSQTPCKYCKYHPLCGFDARLEGYDYRRISGSDGEIMEAITNKVKGEIQAQSENKSDGKEE
ncbi:ATP-dependent nuclease, subunit B [Anaerovibrio sp. JC8]|uniref:helicase-exonuclease AddAB subunit AddB n=1 Tax=Anaerovibrio sp. JC8 TaxID=1240085 RepID=UPI000A0C948D|nr:helicase-exonuclease AddAB subunit AddB [Anaerovibrio sp. JC8]ORT99579.1 ATP-dependent nuclease, subunit B [Anaerovibrio sp. JC8]